MFGLLAAAVLALQPGASTAVELRRYPAPEANQGVAVDARHIYAVDDSAIAEYDKATGRKVGEWVGDPVLYPHINSCEIIGRELVCASSNFPKVPMASTVEIFDPRRMVHLRSIPLGPQPGSLTWVDRRDGAWWAMFANYDGHGGQPGRDHTATTLVKFDDNWRQLDAWTLPSDVLDRMAPKSSSGGGWGDDGLLYVTGHDRPELYAIRLPSVGSVLVLIATIAIPVDGQAIAWDPSQKRVLFGVERGTKEIVEMKLPPIPREEP